MPGCNGRGLGRCASGSRKAKSASTYGRGAGCARNEGAGNGRSFRGRCFDASPRPWFDAGAQGSVARHSFAESALEERKEYLAAELARMERLIASAGGSEKLAQ